MLLGGMSLLPYFGTAGAAHVLGNSAAIWLACAYAIGARSGGYLRGAAAGVVLLLVTLTVFFAGTHLLYPANSSFVAEVAFGDTLWLLPAVCGGSTFGALGWLWRSPQPVLQALASSAMGAAFLALFLAFHLVGGLAPRLSSG